MIKVWIVARHPLLQEGLRALLTREPDLESTVVEAPQLAELINGAAEETPDALLVDVQVLEQEGWDLIRDLISAAPRAPVLLVGDSPSDRRIALALELGARGYLLRDLSSEQMASAIRSARLGLAILHPAVAVEWGVRRSASPRGEADADEAPLEGDLVDPLSPREIQVLQLLARGMPNKQIAAALFITEHTVKYHIRSILGKLGAGNRTEAVTLAIQRGLVAV